MLRTKRVRILERRGARRRRGLATTALDVGIEGGKVVELEGSPGASARPARRSTPPGLHVLPGAIDIHFHCRAPEPPRARHLRRARPPRPPPAESPRSSRCRSRSRPAAPPRCCAAAGRWPSARPTINVAPVLRGRPAAAAAAADGRGRRGDCLQALHHHAGAGPRGSSSPGSGLSSQVDDVLCTLEGGRRGPGRPCVIHAENDASDPRSTRGPRTRPRRGSRCARRSWEAVAIAEGGGHRQGGRGAGAHRPRLLAGGPRRGQGRDRALLPYNHLGDMPAVPHARHRHRAPPTAAWPRSPRRCASPRTRRRSGTRCVDGGDQRSSPATTPRSWLHEKIGISSTRGAPQGLPTVELLAARGARRLGPRRHAVWSRPWSLVTSAPAARLFGLYPDKGGVVAGRGRRHRDRGARARRSRPSPETLGSRRAAGCGIVFDGMALRGRVRSTLVLGRSGVRRRTRPRSSA